MATKTSVIKRINSFIIRYSPPGAELRSEYLFYTIGNIVSLTVSLIFFASYVSERSKLYNYDRVLKKYILDEAATMTKFNDVIDGYLLGFVLLAVILLSFIIFRYSYYRQGTKSIYLMKRLPNRTEIHKRALTVPILASLTCLIYAFVLRILYFAIYVIATPNKCLPAGLWEQFWRFF